MENTMKNLKGFVLGLSLGLSLAISGLAFAQNTSTDQAKDAPSCCAKMKDGCCCGGDSCDMKMKHDAKDSTAQHSCCCCGGDSCDMKMKHDAPEKPSN
jgi:hypothetical protein